MSTISSPPSLLALLFVAVAVVVWWRLALRLLAGCVIVVLIVGLHQLLGQVQPQSSVAPFPRVEAGATQAAPGAEPGSAALLRRAG